MEHTHTQKLQHSRLNEKLLCAAAAGDASSSFSFVLFFHSSIQDFSLIKIPLYSALSLSLIRCVFDFVFNVVRRVHGVLGNRYFDVRSKRPKNCFQPY